MIQKTILYVVLFAAVFLVACSAQPASEPVIVPGPEDPDMDDEIECTADVICCNGEAMGRDPATGCGCPEGMNLTPDACSPSNGFQNGEEMACTRDARQCPDGSFVGRDGFNNCEFHPCPELQRCDANNHCEDGFSCYALSGEQAKCYSDEVDICYFAGCEEQDTCVVMESYPMQVACR